MDVFVDWHLTFKLNIKQGQKDNENEPHSYYLLLNKQIVLHN